ncbi:hypothetical protein PP175_01475 [Aneurinibacillus sp. Ricciae_BoGa-3]|uniref:hypothetical protein n=1 Tax=Aneurinibacillus sp. Ricciae_BoGa-3 TaxID=3022697 RepID=UPI002340F7B0|nr:hypothetical protein [Aneurinibacillus sp. Ricciae_BoGa-3]WCK54737.1 hypothetical protein PP175_01475 [Aneurinibacillus sp. Ricciae_BoGa-3]
MRDEWTKLDDLCKAWEAVTRQNNGKAYRPEDVPPTFRWTNVYFQRAVAAMAVEQDALNKYVAADKQGIFSEALSQKSTLNYYEQQYTTNKNLYSSYITELNKTHY